MLPSGFIHNSDFSFKLQLVDFTSYHGDQLINVEKVFLHASNGTRGTPNPLKCVLSPKIACANGFHHFTLELIECHVSYQCGIVDGELPAKPHPSQYQVPAICFPLLTYASVQKRTQASPYGVDFNFFKFCFQFFALLLNRGGVFQLFKLGCR